VRRRIFSNNASEFKKSMFIAKLPWAIIGLFILFQAASYLVNGLNYSLKSQQSSPDGRKTVFEFQSHQDGRDHAPYGSTLSLSFDRSIHQPDSGYVFFAGYCKQPVTYSWQGNEKIVVNCQSSQKNKEPRTQAIRMYGIAVELKTE
jgi:hypothetical protein